MSTKFSHTQLSLDVFALSALKKMVIYPGDTVSDMKGQTANSVFCGLGKTVESVRNEFGPEITTL